MQLEVPIDTVEYAATIANRYGKKIILNPAPASTLSNSFLNNVHTILPNRIEAEMLSGIKVMDIESAHRAAKAIGEKGIENVVITLGKDGAYVKEKDEYTMIPAKEVETIDTTGAGDVFCGAFSVYLSQGHSLAESVKFANAAAAIAVTRIGAQSAIPYKGKSTYRIKKSLGLSHKSDSNESSSYWKFKHRHGCTSQPSPGTRRNSRRCKFHAVPRRQRSQPGCGGSQAWRLCDVCHLFGE